METLLNNPPPADEVGELLKVAPRLGHPDRAEWNRRLDEALAKDAAHVATHAQAAKAEALRRGDARSAVAAGAIERRARRAIDAVKN